MDESQYFYVNDGSVLKDLNDFTEKMKNISQDAFSHHVNLERNDFASWTKEVLKDGVLARSILKAKAPEEIVKSIERRLTFKEKMKIKKEDKKAFISEIKEAHV